MRPSSIVLLAAAVAAPALADIYKYERADGTVVYSDGPVQGARLVERFAIARAPATPQAPAGRPQAPGPRPEVVQADPQSPLDVADAEVRAAQKAVEDARARVQQGAEPLPGERAGIGGGKSRLTEEYFGRQKALQEELADANRRLELAYQHRNQTK
jgi:hypothetical protein